MTKRSRTDRKQERQFRNSIDTFGNVQERKKLKRCAFKTINRDTNVWAGEIVTK